jgi:hypothetical protein
LAFAVLGGDDVHQCRKCCKYFTTLKSCLKHIRLYKNCWKTDYEFATYAGRYFCYFGCQTFLDRLQLVAHLIKKHYEQRDELKKWGFSMRSLLYQADTMSEQDCKRILSVFNKKKRIRGEARQIVVELARIKR